RPVGGPLATNRNVLWYAQWKTVWLCRQWRVVERDSRKFAARRLCEGSAGTVRSPEQPRQHQEKPMKKSLAGALLVLSVIAAVAIVRAQDKKEPEHKLIEFHMALLKRGPNYNAAGMPKDMQSGHFANVMSLLESGKAVIARPPGAHGEIAGIIVFRGKSAEEARAWADADPAVKAGFFVAEMHQIGRASCRGRV